MEYRLLTVKDFPAYDALRGAALDVVPEAFGSTNQEEAPHRKDRFISNVTHDTNFIFGAFDGDTLVGMVGFMKLGKIKIRHKGIIWGMYVQPDKQGHGIGSTLMKNTLQKAAQIKELQQIKLDVNAENQAAIHLYKKVGFSAYGTEKNALFVNGKMYDVILMSMPIR